MKKAFDLKAIFHPVQLTLGSCWKTILLFSLPIIVSYLLQQVYSISDAAIVGQTLTADEVAGVTDTTPLVFVFLQFAFGSSAGFCAVTSCRVGTHDDQGVRRSLATQFVLSTVLTVVLTALALALLNPMLAWINVTPDSPAVYNAAHTYCMIIFSGIGAQLFYNFICSFLRAMGDSVTPLMFLLFSTVLNVGLDLLFILSFGWGVAGAAIATVLAQLISTVACFLYAFSRYPELRLHREDFAITKSDLSQHIAQGVPLGLQFSVLSVGIITMQSVVVQFDMQAGLIVSNAAQNGFGAANKLHMLTMTPLNAFGTALTSFTAQNLGAGKYDRIKQGTYACMFIGILYCVLFVLIAQFGTRYLALLFMNADEAANVMDYTQQLSVAFAYATPLLLAVNVLRLSIQGMGYSRLSLISGLLEMLARTVVSLWAVPAFGFDAACLASPFAWLLADCFLIPAFYGCLNARRRQAARVRQELPSE